MANKFDGMKISKTVGDGAGDAVLKLQQQGASQKGQQQLVTPLEKAERETQGRTQGRKGCKSSRINMAFWTENYHFVKTMARISGQTMTEYVNRILDEYRKEHSETYENAQRLLADVEKEGE